jgi:hypothetical protein
MFVSHFSLTIRSRSRGTPCIYSLRLCLGEKRCRLAACCGSYVRSETGVGGGAQCIHVWASCSLTVLPDRNYDVIIGETFGVSLAYSPFCLRVDADLYSAFFGRRSLTRQAGNHLSSSFLGRRRRTAKILAGGFFMAGFGAVNFEGDMVWI